MKKDRYFLIKMKKRPVFPYICISMAKSKTAAIRAFIEHLTDKGYSSTKSSISAYTAEEVTQKYAVRGSQGMLKLGFVGKEPTEKMSKGKKKRKLV